MKRTAVLILGSLSFIANAAYACDLCAIYSSIDTLKPTAGAVHVGLAQQYSSFRDIQDDGRRVENVAGEWMQSSHSQLFGSYDFSRRYSIQLTLPFINRRYRRVEGEAIQRGVESGIGDATILAKYIPYQYQGANSNVIVQLSAGLKLPTGDSDQLEHEHESEPASDEHEEDSEHHDDHEAHQENEALHLAQSVSRHAGHEHSAPVSAIHGHDLALGSGSFDFPLAANILVQHRKFLFSGSVQYMIRTEGDHDYTFADDLLWDIGPGYFVNLDHDSCVALKVNLSGEYKRKDKLDGAREVDTGIRSLFVGPEVIYTSGNWSIDLGLDLPVDINNTGYQAVVDHKVRAAVSYRF